MRCLAILQAAVSALVMTAPAAAGDTENRAINGVYAKISAAREGNDVAGMAEHFDGKGILIDARPGPAIAGSELAQRLQPMADRIRSDGVKVTTAYRIERRSLLGDSVIDAGYMRQTMTRPTGQASTRYTRFMVAMRRSQGGAWRIVGDASMPAEEAAFTAVPRQSGLHHDS